MNWVVEQGLFSYDDTVFAGIARSHGHKVVAWQDDWWANGKFPELSGPVVFRGSLSNADRIASELAWSPGSFCALDEFHCSSWYPRFEKELVNERWVRSTVAALARGALDIASRLQADEQVFVRPDSPLKPFSGRVLPIDGITLDALDHGFYYEDEQLPVIVSPVRSLGAEYRFVVVQSEPVAGCSYGAAGRSAESSLSDDHPAWSRAAEVIRSAEPPEVVCVMDLAEVEGSFRLLEFNPFSGADLYACDLHRVIARVAELLERA